MHMNKYLAMGMKQRKCDDKGVRKIQWLLKENVWEMPLNVFVASYDANSSEYSHLKWAFDEERKFLREI